MMENIKKTKNMVKVLFLDCKMNLKFTKEIGQMMKKTVKEF